MSFSLLEKLAPVCSQSPDRPALRDGSGPSISFQQLHLRIHNIAAGFRSAGLRPGDRVLYAVRPDAECELLMMAIYEAGGVLVPIDAGMGDELFAKRLHLLRPRWVVAESLLYFACANRLAKYWLARRGLQLPPLDQVPGATLVHVGARPPGIAARISTRQLEHSGAQASPLPISQGSDDDPAMIVFTSGTTSAPKAVVHTRRSMQGIFNTISPLLNMIPGDVMYARELHLILPALFGGNTVVVPPRSKFSARRTFETLTNHDVTHFFSVVADLQKLVRFMQHHQLALPVTLREIWVGAAPVRSTFLQELRKVLPAHTRVWCVYGMTEILPVARVALDDKLNYQGNGDLIGNCIPGVSAMVSDDGELMLQGENLFDHYLGEARCQLLATGDLACIEDNQIVLLGRRKDMIIRGQFNIYPELYEPTIEQIVGVQHCAMIGVFDAAIADERVVLVVEANTGHDADTLKELIADELRNGSLRIDALALPDEIVMMPIPMSGRSKKVDKNTLRDHLQRVQTCA